MLNWKMNMLVLLIDNEWKPIFNNCETLKIENSRIWKNYVYNLISFNKSHDGLRG